MDHMDQSEKDTGENLISRSLRLTPAQWDAIDTCARDRRTTRSQVIREALAKLLGVAWVSLALCACGQPVQVAVEGDPDPVDSARAADDGGISGSDGGSGADRDGAAPSAPDTGVTVEAPDGSARDAGAPDVTTSDSSVPVYDAGEPDASDDSGTTNLDAGDEDSGWPLNDSGLADSGAGWGDAGTGDEDAGYVEVDAGPLWPCDEKFFVVEFESSVIAATLDEFMDACPCAQLWYRDIDNDGYGSPWPTTTLVACEEPDPETYNASFVLNNDDCYDPNGIVNPGYSGGGRVTHRGDGSWDYNCDGVETHTGTDVHAYCDSGCY